jgi:hypothetical protein
VEPLASLPPGECEEIEAEAAAAAFTAWTQPGLAETEAQVWQEAVNAVLPDSAIERLPHEDLEEANAAAVTAGQQAVDEYRQIYQTMLDRVPAEVRAYMTPAERRAHGEQTLELASDSYDSALPHHRRGSR